MPEPSTVQLGTHRYVVVPQRQARLARAIPAVFDGMGSQDAGANGLLSMLTERTYDLLRVFIPDLMPRWEWDGYADESAAATDAYDEAADRSPTVVETQAALGKCLEVNGIDRFKLLGNFISPELVRAVLSQQMVDTLIPARSLNSPAQNGAPASTTSGATSPTSDGLAVAASGDGLSPA